jgi:hypothetical protein
MVQKKTGQAGRGSRGDTIENRNTGELITPPLQAGHFIISLNICFEKCV